MAKMATRLAKKIKLGQRARKGPKCPWCGGRQKAKFNYPPVRNPDGSLHRILPKAKNCGSDCVGERGRSK